MKNILRIFLSSLICCFSLVGCSQTENPSTEIRNPEERVTPEVEEENEEELAVNYNEVYRGADLSYVNEMEDCGGVYLNEGGEEVEPFAFFREQGANLIRVRLWHSPDWTDYSNLEDVKKTISRAKGQDMEVLLDFHYSDTWADPEKQIIPAAWKHINNDEVLADSLYNYTYKTLEKLKEAGLLPDIVQVGNEINREILQPEGAHSERINWERNTLLINSGIQAVRDLSVNIEIMLHIAQPENALWWFKEAHENNIGEYDWIGLSYYPIWSTYDMENIPTAIQELKEEYNKRIMIVETAYPHSLLDVDSANNILGSGALIEGYAARPEGQRKYMIDLLRKTTEGGAEGVIYWEPAWISTNCHTLWGQGSHWDNATMFDAETFKALPAFDFYEPENY